MTLRRALLMLATLCVWVTMARAADQERRAEAKRLKEQAAREIARGELPTALGHLQEAYRVFPSPNLRYNLAQVLVALGRHAEAAAELERFLAEATTAPADAKAHASTMLAELEGRLSRLEIHGEPAGAEILVDGRAVGALPLNRPVWLSPGGHVIVASRAGFRYQVERITAERGSKVVITVRLSAEPTAVVERAPAGPPASAGPRAEEPTREPTPAPPSPGTEPSPPPPEMTRGSAVRPRRFIAPIVVGSASLALLGLGAGLLGSAAADHASLTQDCRARPCGPADWAGAERRDRTGVAFLALGGVAAAVDLVLWIVEARRRAPAMTSLPVVSPAQGRW